MVEEKIFLEKERIAVFLGKDGKQKEEYEKVFNAKIEVNSKTGEVTLNAEDNVNLFILSNIITAINYGQNPQNALKLEDETFVLDIIDIKDSIKDINRLKVIIGRIIGKDGVTRKIIEDTSKCNVSIKGHIVSIIGPYENVIIVHEAILMLIKGVSHKSLYGFLEKNTLKFNKGLN